MTRDDSQRGPQMVAEDDRIIARKTQRRLVVIA
jgi:hypothetical protein